MTATLDTTQALADRLRRFVGRRVRNAHDADDLVQDVLLKLHLRGGELPTERQRRAWALRVARNAIIDLHRRRAARPDVSLDGQTLIGLAEPEGVDASSLACLSRMMDRLAPDYRQALRLADIDGLTGPEIAGKLGLSVSGVKSRVQRARGQMRGMVLDCCDLEFDARGGLVDYHPTPRAPQYCGDACADG